MNVTKLHARHNKQKAVISIEAVDTPAKTFSQFLAQAQRLICIS